MASCKLIQRLYNKFQPEASISLHVVIIGFHQSSQWSQYFLASKQQRELHEYLHTPWCGFIQDAMVGHEICLSVLPSKQLEAVWETDSGWMWMAADGWTLYGLAFYFSGIMIWLSNKLLLKRKALWTLPWRRRGWAWAWRAWARAASGSGNQR